MEKRDGLAAKALIATLIYYSAAAALYFAAAGRLDLPLAWLYFIVNAAVGFALALVLGRKDPGLLEERLKPGPGEKDKIFRSVHTTLMAVQLAIAGIDAGRLHWFPTLSPILQVTALWLVSAGLTHLDLGTVCQSLFLDSSALRA